MRSFYGRTAVFAILTISLMLDGCSRSATASAPRTDRSILSHEQLGDHRYSNAYDAVEALRSNWLNTRGTDSFRNPSQVRVYLDNVSLGDVQTLKTIAISAVVYIRYFDGVTATSRWGLNHGAGVIYVSTRPLGHDPDQ
ncbi:MAG TPA: hypothetical protein VIP11_10630 [Gemmatimonadaceae bacterium]